MSEGDAEPQQESQNDEQRTDETVEVKEKKEQEQQPWDACCGILGTLTARD